MSTSVPSSSTIVSCLHAESNITTVIPRLVIALRFILVGLGAKGKDCGKIFASHVCDNIACGKVHYSHHWCMRKECPHCYRMWLRWSVDAIVARLYSSEAIRRNKGKRLAHIILSLKASEEITSKKMLDKMIQGGYRYAKRCGIRGGVVIFHAFRATLEAKKLSKKAGMKTWTWIRAQPNPERYYRYSPHLHVVGYINYLQKPQKGSKWVYKSKVDVNGKIRDMSISVSKTSEDDLRRVVHYLLTHAVSIVDTRFDSIRWFGNCSTRAFPTTPEEEMATAKLEPEEKYCKVCGAPLVPFWDWIYEHYYYVMSGMVPEPEYFQEIQECKWGEDPPDDAEEYVV